MAKFKKGDSLSGAIKASTWNRVESIFGGPDLSKSGLSGEGSISKPQIVRIKNDSGSDLERGRVLSWDDVVFDAATNESQFALTPILSGKLPEFPEDGQKVAVLVQPIKDGKVGYAAIKGTVMAYVEVQSADHQFCYLSDGSTDKLVSGTSGFAKIIAGASTVSTTPAKCLVDLGESQLLWLIEKTGDTTDGRIEGSLLGLDEIDTGVTITVNESLGLSLAVGGRLLVQQSGAGFYGVQSRSDITLAQAPFGGVPAMTGVRPGEASCELIKTATEFGTGYQPGDLITYNEFVTVRNWTNSTLGDSGSRLIMIAEPNDGALLVGAVCNDEGTPSDIKREFAPPTGAARTSSGSGGGGGSPPPIPA